MRKKGVVGGVVVSVVGHRGAGVNVKLPNICLCFTYVLQMC
jgi:hypothetical protein